MAKNERKKRRKRKVSEWTQRRSKEGHRGAPLPPDRRLDSLALLYHPTLDPIYTKTKWSSWANQISEMKCQQKGIGKTDKWDTWGFLIGLRSISLKIDSSSSSSSPISPSLPPPPPPPPPRLLFVVVCTATNRPFGETIKCRKSAS